jgi:hypothetical protein
MRVYRFTSEEKAKQISSPSKDTATVGPPSDHISTRSRRSAYTRILQNFVLV